MAPAPLPDRHCRFIGDGLDADALVRELVELGAIGAASVRPEQSVAARPPGAVEHIGEGEPAMWVVGELHDGALAPVSVELASKAAELAPKVGGGVAVLLLGDDVGSAAEQAARHGADVVMAARDPELVPYRAEPHARVVVDAVRAARPAAILFGATTTGRDLAPRVAGMLDTGLAADCTDLEVQDWERRGTRYEALLHQVRPAMAGGVLATCVCPSSRPQMATVRPGVFAVRDLPRAENVRTVEVALEPSDLRVEVLDREVTTAHVGLADADVVIAGGAGCDAESWHLVEELAEAFGGRVAASRGAVEAGLAPRALQVGQTGTTVHPRLYVACGISGALQHAVGMHDARTVVAVNRDPDAFIFRLAHFGIVAEVGDAVPELIAALRRSEVVADPEEGV